MAKQNSRAVKAKSTTSNSSKRLLTRFNWKTAVGLLAIGGFMYLILPHLGQFHSSLVLLKHLNTGWLLLALAASLATYFAAAGIYLVLAKHSLRYGPTLLIQCAGTFANRLLPGGIGALGVNYEYLRKRRHSLAEAGSVIATNNLCGLAGHVIVLLFVLVFVPHHLAPISIPHPGAYIYWAIGGIIALVTATLTWSRKLRNELFRTIIGVVKNIGRYRTHPLRLLSAVSISMSLTLCYVTCLAACGQALNLHLAFSQIFIVMTAGIVAGTVTPTPGGLLGAEAGLLAGLVAYGVAAAPALAVVLVYRLLTYWLALIFGSVALLVSDHLGYL